MQPVKIDHVVMELINFVIKYSHTDVSQVGLRLVMRCHLDEDVAQPQKLEFMT